MSQNQDQPKRSDKDNTQSQKPYTIQPAQDDDDIQEVVAVKAEPLASNIHENIHEGSSNTYGRNTANTVAVDQPLEQMYDDSYNEYENYEEGAEGGYEGALMDPNVILSQANADNKGNYFDFHKNVMYTHVYVNFEIMNDNQLLAIKMI